MMNRTAGVRVNEKDLMLVRSISAELNDGGKSSLYLLNAKYTSIVRVDLVLLKVFLEEKHKRGIMVTIDRPHQYVSHLLQLHGVDQANLTFVDVISSHAADTKGGAVAPEFSRGPFQIGTLPEFLMNPPSVSSVTTAKPSDMDFVILDNVSTLLNYNSMDSVMEFFRKYSEVTRMLRERGVKTILVMDRDMHPALYDFLSSMARKMIDLGPDMIVKKVVVAEVSETPVVQVSPQAEAGLGGARDSDSESRDVT